MEQTTTLKKYTLILAFLFLTFGGLYFARSFLIPFFTATLIAMLLLPVAQFLEKKGLNRGFSISLCIILLLLLVSLLIFLLSAQVRLFAEDIPAYRLTVNEKFTDLREFIAKNFHITQEEQTAYLQNELENLLVSATVYFRSAILMTSNFLVSLSIIIFYIFFFLFYRNKFHKFILMITKPESHSRTMFIIQSSTSMTMSYLGGVLIVVSILTALNSIGLWIIGIPHPFFLGFIAALLNIIPFIGSVVGSIIPMLVAFLTMDSIWYMVAVGILFTTIQMIESYVLTPKITGGKIRLNPLATIVALIVGGLLWGIAGMILFIPMLGILKVLFRHIEHLNPFAYLIGAETADDKDKKQRKQLINSWKNLFKKGAKA
ncbi:MAG: AI-2E family transporter [Cytophagaceae bacterium]